MTRRISMLGLPLLMSILLAGCGSVTGVDSFNDSIVADQAAISTENASSGTSNVAMTAEDTDRPKLALAVGGLTLVRSDTSATRALAFGTPRADVEQAVETAIGTGKPGNECAIAPLATTRYPGIDLTFSEGKFVGWTASPDVQAPRLATATGIGVGSTRKALEAVYHVSVTETSLGLEFNVDSFDGLFTSAEPDSTISNLWAGETCIAR